MFFRKLLIFIYLMINVHAVLESIFKSLIQLRTVIAIDVAHSNFTPTAIEMPPHSSLGMLYKSLLLIDLVIFYQRQLA